MIVPAFTMIAVANAVTFVGAKPIFADNSSDNRYNPGWNEIEESISGSSSVAQVKAVIVSHTYGIPAPGMDQIYENCQQRGWKLIEDISEVVGIEWDDSRLLGSIGDFATASLYANKIVHAGDGGFVLAKDPTLKSHLKSLANHGFTPDFHFVHFERAMNAKINGLGAALACGNLDQLDEALETRRALSSKYRQGLSGLPLRLMPQCGGIRVSLI